METHDGQRIAPFTSAEMRDLIHERIGYRIAQPTFSQWLTKGFVLSSARFAGLPAFTDADVAYNLRFLELNYNPDTGMISKRRHKKLVRGHLGDYGEDVRGE